MEEKEGDDGGRLCGDAFGKIKCAKERGSVEEGREECENGENVKLGNGHELAGVQVIPVSELVSEHSFNFFRFGLLNECIENHNMFALYI